MKTITKIFLTFMFIDIVSTLLAYTFGLGVESWAPTLFVLEKIGWVGIAIYKIIYIAICVFCFQSFDINRYKIYWAVCIFPAFASLNNAFVIIVTLLHKAGILPIVI